MKRPKRLTRAQKEIVSNHKLNPDNWMFKKETETQLVVAHKHGPTERKLDKSKNLRKEK